MDKQQTFDLVVAHARKQQCKSIREGTRGENEGKPACLYRGPDGTKCFVGALIPDDKYNGGLEGWSADNKRVRSILLDLGHNLDLCFRLQNVHDASEVAEWEKGFMVVAEKYELVYTEEVNNG